MQTLGNDTVLAGRYRLGELLGRGGMADVFDAVDERLHRRVAVKVLRPELAADPDVRRRFDAEARSAARLAHPNVVTVFDTGEDAGVPFLVMERLPGETLADRMVDGPPDGAWVLRVAGDVLLALGAAHAAGVIHRDVKPGNILIGPDGCAKVADFGIAKLAEVSSAADLTRTNQMLGTPAYVAPERIVGEPATERSDLYALGVVLYEAFTGAKPYTGSTPVAVAYAIRHADAVPLAEHRPDLDPAVTAAVDRAMAREPGDRFPNAAAMAAALGVAGPADARGSTDETVFAIPADATAVLPATPPVAVAAVPDPVPVSALVPGAGVRVDEAAHPRRPWELPRSSVERRRWIGLAVLAGVLALGLLVVAMAAGSHSGSLAGDLRDTASSLDPAKDGAAAGPAADQLRAVADAVDHGNGGPAATMALASVAKWRDAGQLRAGAVDRTSSVLERVPGVDRAALSSAPATTAATAPSTTVVPPPAGRGDGKRHGKHGD